MFASLAIGKTLGGLAKSVLGFFTGLTARQWGIIVIVAALGFCQYKFYQATLEKGRSQQLAIDQPIIDKANQDKNKANADLKMYKDSFLDWVSKSAEARKLYEKEQGKLVTELETRLTTAERQRAKDKKDRLREISKYIPKDSVTDFDLSVGFVRLFDLSLEREGAEGVALNPLSRGLTSDVETPSGIKLSGGAATFVENNAECVARGEVIQAWQEWYVRSKAAYDKALKAQNTPPKVLTDSVPSTAITPPPTP